MSIVQPSIRVLSQDQIQQVHDYSLRILGSVGVRVDSPRALELFSRALGPSAVYENRVYIPPEAIDWALRAAPRAIEVYNRRGELAFRLPGEPRFGIGVTALYYQDPQTDEVVPFSRSHMARTVRLGGGLDSYDLISTVGIVQDVPAQVSDLYATLEMVANTIKPLVILVSDDDAFLPVLDLVEHLHGDLGGKPFVVPYLNPISPLVINRGTVDKLFAAAEWGLPCIYSNYGMAGASTPITPAGTLALLNAELLAGLVLSQLIKEGTPIILGSLPAYFDMRGMGSFYDARSYVIDLACAEMMAYYRLPHCGTSGSGMGWGADLIAAGHQWLNHLVSCAGKVGLVPFVGDNLGSKAFSPTVIVYANEVIEQARIFARGFSLTGEAVGLDEIAALGPGASFLTSPQTLKMMRSAYHESSFFPKLTLEEWQARSRPKADALLREHTARLIHELPAPEDHKTLLDRGTAFIRSVTSRQGAGVIGA
jgi:trimethylamine---corrinoid protein Co-methyltransferase